MSSKKPLQKEVASVRKQSWFRRFIDGLPNKKQLLYLPHVLSFKERYTILGLLLIALASLVFIPLDLYYHNSGTGPGYGGSFKEGIIGYPHQINPLLAQASDVDRDLSSLVYAGLMKYDGLGQLKPDLAESYSISADGLTYSFVLREHLKWQDGQDITPEDVIFTVLTAQNADFGSAQRINWQGISAIKKDNRTVSFTLKNKYASFLNNTTLGILPKHIWENITANNFASSDFNLKPIGSGPYKFSKLTKDPSGNVVAYELSAFADYNGAKPYISKAIFQFYPSEDDLIKAYNGSQIDSLSYISPQKISSLHLAGRLNIHELKLPRYFATFFNQNKSSVLADKNVRLALSYATDKQELIKDVLNGKALAVDSPIVPNILSLPDTDNKYAFDPSKATSILDDAHWQLSNGSRSKEGTKTKGSVKTESTKLSFELTTSNWPELVTIANHLKQQWEAVGFTVNLRILSVPELQQAIKNRDYEALLFGEVLGLDDDPFRFWHSSEKRDPGLNLALYGNGDVDKLLEDARQTLDPTVRIGKYVTFQNIITKDIPALFLYSPTYLYAQSVKIKNNTSETIGIASDRLNTINTWYINTDRSLFKK